MEHLVQIHLTNPQPLESGCWQFAGTYQGRRFSATVPADHTPVGVELDEGRVGFDWTLDGALLKALCEQVL